MKTLVLLCFMAFLMLALDAGEASLLGIGSRSRTKKLRDQKTTEAPYVCLDPPIDLPFCNFVAEDDEKMEKSSKQRGALAHFGISDPLKDSEESSARENPESVRALTIVYKIEGCIPSRLPFVLPICERKVLSGRIVEVRRLFPFEVVGNSKVDPGVPLVFPELDMNEWNRFIKGPWTRPVKNEDDIETTRVNVPQDEESPVAMRKKLKRKKFENNGETDEKTVREKFTPLKVSKNIGENDLFPELPSSSLAKHRMMEDRGIETSFYKTRSTRANRLNDEEERESEKKDHRRIDEKISTDYHEKFPYEMAIPYDQEKLLVARLGSEFPYTRAIPYDPEKLKAAKLGTEFPSTRAISYNAEKLAVAKLGSEFSYTRAISYDSEKLAVAKLGSEFPYTRAISYDPEKLGVAKLGSVFPYTRAISYDPEKIVVARLGSEFPYTRAILYDPEKLVVARMGSEFPYTRAISYDPEKLQTTRRESEFPYATAIPYDPKKLEKRKSEAVERPLRFYARKLKVVETREDNFQDVPFDTSMLAAAKEGGTFPYSKETPVDTSKIIETTKQLPSSKVQPERIKIPPRRDMTFWSSKNEVPTLTRKLQMIEDEPPIDSIRQVDDRVENILDIKKIDDEASRSDVSLLQSPRVPRSVIESSMSDASTVSDAHKVPRRWSEFPYSKAIAFDPEKLRRLRSAMVSYGNSLIPIPRDFPYARAIPYDPWKLTAFRRKEIE